MRECASDGASHNHQLFGLCPSPTSAASAARATFKQSCNSKHKHLPRHRQTSHPPAQCRPAKLVVRDVREPPWHHLVCGLRCPGRPPTAAAAVAEHSQSGGTDPPGQPTPRLQRLASPLGDGLPKRGELGNTAWTTAYRLPLGWPSGLRHGEARLRRPTSVRRALAQRAPLLRDELRRRHMRTPARRRPTARPGELRAHRQDLHRSDGLPQSGPPTRVRHALAQQPPILREELRRRQCGPTVDARTTTFDPARGAAPPKRGPSGSPTRPPTGPGARRCRRRWGDARASLGPGAHAASPFSRPWRYPDAALYSKPPSNPQSRSEAARCLGRAVARSGGRSGAVHRSVCRSGYRSVGLSGGQSVCRPGGRAIGRAGGRVVGRTGGRAVNRSICRSFCRAVGRAGRGAAAKPAIDWPERGATRACVRSRLTTPTRTRTVAPPMR